MASPSGMQNSKVLIGKFPRTKKVARGINARIAAAKLRLSVEKLCILVLGCEFSF